MFAIAYTNNIQVPTIFDKRIKTGKGGELGFRQSHPMLEVRRQ